jgi:hypothetical protein
MALDDGTRRIPEEPGRSKKINLPIDLLRNPHLALEFNLRDLLEVEI